MFVHLDDLGFPTRILDAGNYINKKYGQEVVCAGNVDAKDQWVGRKKGTARKITKYEGNEIWMWAITIEHKF